MSKEFYYDDLVLTIAEESHQISVGLVTKDKPFTSNEIDFLKKSVQTNTLTDSENNDGFSLVKIDDKVDNDDEDDFSDGNLYDPPQVENVNVNWFIHKFMKIVADDYNSFIEAVPGKQLQLLDRTLDIADIVKMNVNNEVKVGAIFNLKMYADVMLLGLNKVIKNVDCSNLKWIEPFMGKNLETNFSYQSWLGEVMDLSLEVIIRFSDGARLKVSDDSLSEFEHVFHMTWNSDIILENCIMEGDALNLKSRKSKFLNETVKHNSKWLYKLKKSENVNVLIEKVIPVQANMQWIFGYSQSNALVPETPPQTLKGKELDKLERVHPHSWHAVTVGDIWYYNMENDDTIYDCDPNDLGNFMYKLVNDQLVEYDASTQKKNELSNPCDRELNTHFTEQNASIVNTIGYNSSGGFVIKPHKKVLYSSKQRRKKKSISSKLTNGLTSDDENNGESTENCTENETCFQETAQIPLSNDNLQKELLQKIAFSQNSGNDSRSPSKIPVGILLTRCFVDIHWQDGTIDYDVPTKKLLPQMYNIDEHDFFPGDFITQKFDPQNPIDANTAHNFGTVICSNTKDRVATVQWFDYLPDNDGSHVVTKAGEPEQVGVYDIAALNEHHFMLGQEVIVKQEATYNNYPAGYVSKLNVDEGLLIVRWPDGKELGVSPTDLLLTVESAVGGQNAGLDSSDYEDSDCDLDDCDDNGSFTTADLDSSDDDEDNPQMVNGDVTIITGQEPENIQPIIIDDESSQGSWETIEEVETNMQDEAYQKKIDQSRVDLLKLRKKINKLLKILGNVSDFTMIIQANLPPHMGQLLNVKKLFGDLNETTSINYELKLPDQQYALRHIFEIRRKIALIYKQCKDVEIRRMFQCYKPRKFLSFRNIKNFIVLHMQPIQQHLSPNKSNDSDQNAVNLENKPAISDIIELTHSTDNVHIKGDNNKINQQSAEKLTAKYLSEVYKSILVHLHHLLDSINVWLNERSIYFSNKEEIIVESDSAESHQSDDMKMENVMVNLFSPKSGNQTENQINKSLVTDLSQEDNKLLDITSPKPNINSFETQIGETIISDGNEKSNIITAVSSPPVELDRTFSSNCEPIPEEQRGIFIMSESAPSSHRFYNTSRPSMSNSRFCKAWKRDLKLLTTSLPKGVIVKSYDNRTDLFSLMIVGPAGTPYQHALFFFEIQLGAQYPTVPPNVYFISLAPERVNPNLYIEGRVCLSLLGTWNGKGTENWDSKHSNMLQLIVSLQGLILVSEPYYNEAGFEIRRGSDEGRLNSQKYNENAINNICQSMINLLHKPLANFDNEIREHFQIYSQKLIEVHEFWTSLDESNFNKLKSSSQDKSNNLQLPDFPLAPVSKGFQLSMRRHLNSLKLAIDKYFSEN